MPNNSENALVMKYSDEILEIIDHQDEFVRGDLQGLIEAVVIRIINASQESLSS